MTPPVACIALGVVLLLAGCASDSMLPGGAVTADASTASVPEADGPGTANAGSVPFNPFADPTLTAAGGREVIQQPTLSDVMKPGPLPEMSWGRADAPVTIVQYASMTCPHCRAFHRDTYPELKRAYIDSGKVRYILREFPIGQQSGMATIALRCAKPARYLELYGKFMEQQPSWVSQEVRTEPIFAVAKQVGTSRAEFDSCRQNRGMISALNAIKERGRTLGIIGTPNFFIGNRLIKSTLTIADIRGAVEQSAGATVSVTAQ